MELGSLITIALVAAVLGLGLGVVLGRFVWPSPRRVDLEGLAGAKTQVAQLNQERDALKKREEELEALHMAAIDEAKAAGKEVATLNERVLGLTNQVEDQKRQLILLETQRNQLSDEAKATLAEVERLKEREKNLSERVQEQAIQVSAFEAQRSQLSDEANAALAEVERLKEREKNLSEKLQTQVVQVAELQQQLTTEFENIATRVLKANAAELSENSQKAIAFIIDPLRERIQEFQRKVESTYDTEYREVLSLKDQIRVVLETSNSVGSRADSLAKALRGDSQQLGRWGELALERILEAAGLTEGREFVPQGRGLGFKSEAGGIQKPDIVVMLPEKRTMVVDSKAPLTSYERLIAAKEEQEKALCADQLVRDFKGHIEGLAGKRYQESVSNEKLQPHDCVLMFVPIEGALAAALTRDPELFVYGWQRHVVLVGPPTLLMTLRTVASIWRYELQGQNAQEIARLAGDLCDKVSTSLGDLNGVAEKIRGALDAHNEAVKRLATGKGNALSLGERIRNLGVKTKKEMPAMLVDGISVPAVSLDTKNAVDEEVSVG